MIRAIDIANWFLSKESMTHKKLQKLCYYAQAWYCTLYDGTPLFLDRIEGWVHGPVIPSIYPSYADFRWNAIPRIEGDIPALPDKVISLLDAVYETYGDLTGDQLERLTHNEDPWINSRKGFEPWEPGTNEILCSDMREYYGKKYKESQND